MMGVIEVIGAIVGVLGVLLIPTAFIVAILTGFNLLNFRDALYDRVGHIPGFRSRTRLKAVTYSFIYVLIASVLLVFIGAALTGPAENTESAVSTPTATASPTPSPTPTLTPTRTPSPTPEARPEEPPPESVPEYTVVTVEDISYADVVRIETHVRTSQPVSELSKEELRLIAKEIAAQGTTDVEVNAITVFFWEDDDVIGAETAYARVDWAPYGEWERAGDVETGSYRHHEFTVRIF